MAELYWIPKKRLSYYYKHITSDFAKNKDLYTWIGESWIIFPWNIWKRLCLDEKDICGSVYTILSNPVRDKIIAILPWTKSNFIIKRIREEIDEKELIKVEQICTDMSPTMERISSDLFWWAELVIDRFHVMKNLLEDAWDLRIKIKSSIKNKEVTERKKAKESWTIYSPYKLHNWETLYEAISRASWQFKRRESDWNYNQKRRRILMQYEEIFGELIDLYKYLMKIWRWYDNKNTNRNEAINNLEYIIKIWEKLWKSTMEADTMSKMLSNRKESISNYFLGKHTNGYAEGLNSRIWRLISMSKWFNDKDYMLYRIAKLFS